MFIKDMYTKNRPVISFEIFPPKRDYPIETIYDTLDKLSDLRPDFISVTYGAGGSSRERTVEIASSIKQRYGIESLAHLTGMTSSEEEIDDILSKLKANNVDNILALRGDMPMDPDFTLPSPMRYPYASNLVSKIHQRGGFCVAGACYPEGHIECLSMESDLSYLREKAEAGASFLISQLFFDNELFYDFLDKAAKLNINIPISAGVMPVLNARQIERITSLCGASIPKKFMRIMEKYGENPEALKEAGIAYATEQIVDLLSWEVDGIHIYTMNRPQTIRKIVENISTIRDYLLRGSRVPLDTHVS